ILLSSTHTPRPDIYTLSLHDALPIYGLESRAPRTERAQPAPERLPAYSGVYFSEELSTIYFLTVRDGKLFARHPRGEFELQPFMVDSFIPAGQSPAGRMDFECQAAGRCESFRVSNGRVRNLLFERIELRK